MSGEVAFEREIFIAATPETTFRFFVEPAFMVHWLGHRHVLDPRPGGILRVEVSATAVASGSYTEVTPYRRVAFTWGWEGRADLPPGRSLVEIELIPRPGGTLVRFRHSGLPDNAALPFTPEEHGQRWTRYLGRLQQYAISSQPERRP